MAPTKAKAMDPDEAAVLQEMIAQAEAAPEPGMTKPGTVLESANEGIPSIVGSVKGAGYVYIWDTQTGERSQTNRNMLPTQLKKKRPDGSRIFTTVDPHITPHRGTHKCLLHPDNENRAHYDALGLPACHKSNLVSAFQVTRHMQTRHPAEWATIEQERTDREKREEREFQRALIEQARK